MLTAMIMNIKAAKPFESWSELGLTYILLILTTVFMSSYLLVLKESMNSFMSWYTGTDLDADFMSDLLRNVEM